MTPRGDGGQAAGRLAARLNRIKEQSPQTDRPAPKRNRRITPPPGWEQRTEFVWHRCHSVVATAPPAFAPSPLFPKGGRSENLVFFDTETTGLSGGAGTHVFLAGFGTLQTGELKIQQYFMSDYPGEREFLDLIQKSIGPGKILVSYNGKAFDSQILKNRFIMNGLTLNVGTQLDLLYPVRRLWRDAVPSCSLGTIEEYVLDIHRDNDIPGIMVPDIYFSFLKYGEASQLEPVFTHHQQDIVSLERLLTRMTGILSGEWDDRSADKARLGRWMLDTGFPEGRDILSAAFTAGDPRAGYYLGSYLKRTRLLEEAAAVWSTMYRRDGDLRAAYELAKYTEHKLKDFPAAEAYVGAIVAAVQTNGAVPGIEAIDRLEYRTDRIRRKAHR